jgi:hypothetical protein
MSTPVQGDAAPHNKRPRPPSPGAAAPPSEPVPLWRTCITGVLPRLFEEHKEQFLDALMAQHDMRDAIEERMLARCHPTSVLADEDVIEVIHTEKEDDERYHVGGMFVISLPVARKYQIKVGKFPYRIRAALKRKFQALVEKADRFEGKWGADGVMEFDAWEGGNRCEETNGNAYWVFGRYCEEVQSHVPNVKKDVDLPEEHDAYGILNDPKKICDLFSVQPNTLEFDAVCFNLCDGEEPGTYGFDEFEEVFDAEYRGLFKKDALKQMADGSLPPTQESAPNGQVYTRKARARLFLMA